MGILGEIVTRAATGVVKDAAERAAVGTAYVAFKGLEKGLNAAANAAENAEKLVDATLGDKDTRHYRREQKYLSKDPDSMYLIIQKDNYKKDIFSIYDTEETVKYYVQGKLSSNNLRLKLLDSNKTLVASVEKKFLALRNPLFHESKPADYVLYLDGEEVGTLKTKLSASRENYEIVPYGWVVKGNILKWDFTVFDGDDTVVHISKRKGYDSPTYIIDFPHKQYELIGLLIVLTLICREY